MGEIIYLLTGAMLMSCNVNSADAVSDIRSETWQKQFENARNKGLQTRAGSNDLRFLDYTYLGRIDSESEVSELVDEMFLENSMFVLYRGTGFSDFEIVPIGDIPRIMEIPDRSVDLFKELKQQLKMRIHPGMEAVSLRWSYRGGEFNSTAIVSNDHGGFVYDNIGSYVVEHVTVLSQKEVNEEVGAPLVKTRAESGDGCVRTFHKSDQILSSWFHTVLCVYNISCSSSFNALGILYDRSMGASHDAAVGWSCDARIATIGGALNSSNYHEFAWGYAYGNFSSATLGFGSSGFTIPGGASGETGTEVHRP